MRVDLKHQSSIIMLSVSIEYSGRNLLCDVNNYALVPYLYKVAICATYG